MGPLSSKHQPTNNRETKTTTASCPSDQPPVSVTMDKIMRESQGVEAVVSAQEKGKGVAPANQPSKASSQGRVKSSPDNQPENPGLKRKQTGDQSSQKYPGHPSTKRARPSSSSGNNVTTAWNKRETRGVSTTGEDDKVDMSSISDQHKRAYNPSHIGLGSYHAASPSPAQKHGSPPAFATHHVSRPDTSRAVPDHGVNRDLENQGTVARQQQSDDPATSPQIQHMVVTVDAATLPRRVSRSAINNNHRPNTNTNAPVILSDGGVRSRPGCHPPSSLSDPNNSIHREKYHFFHYFDPSNPYAHLAHNNENKQQQNQQHQQTRPLPPPPQPGTLAHAYSTAKIFYLIHRARLQQNAACPSWWRLPAAEREAQRASAERMRARALYFWFRLHADLPRLWWDGHGCYCRGSGWEAGYDLGGWEFLRGLEDV